MNTARPMTDAESSVPDRDPRRRAAPAEEIDASAAEAIDTPATRTPPEATRTGPESVDWA